MRNIACLLLMLLSACTEQNRDDAYQFLSGQKQKTPAEEVSEVPVEDDIQHLNWFLHDVRH